MGIPKFYRWLSERYPLVNSPLSRTPPPPVDNLYLDLNGVLHNCTHANNDEVAAAGLDEQEVMAKIFNYIDVLFKLMRPSNLFYIAIDGVAPRAKMNQQRSRRFRSARDRAEALEAARAKGEAVDEGGGFDSNCITPGTPFMARVSTNLQFFINKKLSDDEAYRGVTIILSGHEVPGEGEHKIMEYIRANRHVSAQNNARSGGLNCPSKCDNRNMRHCLYGLDADLIMLSLVTHEPHFCLLREVVKYDGGNRGQPSREVLNNPTDSGFNLLQIGLLRDYLADEFAAVGARCEKFKYNFERVIDDFILLCMLVGNDFLPSLPTLDISEGALNKLLDIYKEMLPSVGYLTENGGFANNGTPFELLMRRVGELETETLTSRAADAEKFAGKQKRDKAKMARRGGAGGLQSLAEAMTAGGGLEDENAPVADEGPTMMAQEARDLLLSGNPEGHALWRHRWYSQKLSVKSTEGVIGVVHNYIEALMWVLQYYFRGCVSWNWFYRYHYAPMASDLLNVSHHVATTAFTLYGPLGRPFLPYEQLMSVMPSASAELLPEPYRALMRDPDSRIIDFYPKEFAIDMEGKRADWEGVCLICFVDEHRLVEATSRVWNSGLLSEAERRRNSHGYILTFYHDENCSHGVATPLPRLYGNLVPCKAMMIAEPPLGPLDENDMGFSSGLLKGVRLGVSSPPGFPTLKSLAHSSRLTGAGVNVFGSASKRESLIVELRGMGKDVEITAEVVASAVLGHKCFIEWPFLKEAVVFGVSDRDHIVTQGRDQTLVKKEQQSKGAFSDAVNKLRRETLTARGLDIGNTKILLHAFAVEGKIRYLDGSIHKKFSSEETIIPLQATIKDRPGGSKRADGPGSGDADRSEAVLVSEFPVGTKAVLLSKVYYGCVAHVKGVDGERLSVEVEVGADARQQKHAKGIVKGIHNRFLRSGEIARKLGISTRALGQIASKMTVVAGDTEVDVGINIRDASRGYSVPDLAKLVDAAPSTQPGRASVESAPKAQWQYSDKCLQLLQLYKSRYPFIFQLADQERGDSRNYHFETFFPSTPASDGAAMLTEVRKWLKQQSLMRRPLVKSTSAVASDQAIQNLQLSSSTGNGAGAAKTVLLENVHPGLLMKPVRRGSLAEGLTGGSFDLGDLAVVVVDDSKVPFGMGCVVVGVHEGSNGGALEIICDEDYLGGTDLHGRLLNKSKRGAILPATSLLNVSAGVAVPTPKGFVPRVKRSAASVSSAGGLPPPPLQRNGIGVQGVPPMPAPSRISVQSGGIGPGSVSSSPPAVDPAPHNGSVPTLGDGMKLLTLLQGGAQKVGPRDLQKEHPVVHHQQAAAPMPPPDAGAHLMNLLRQAPPQKAPPPPQPRTNSRGPRKQKPRK